MTLFQGLTLQCAEPPAGATLPTPRTLPDSSFPRQMCSGAVGKRQPPACPAVVRGLCRASVCPTLSSSRSEFRRAGGAQSAQNVDPEPPPLPSGRCLTTLEAPVPPGGCLVLAQNSKHCPLSPFAQSIPKAHTKQDKLGAALALG